MNFQFDIINSIITVSVVVNLLYGYLVYRRNNQSKSNIFFFFLTLSMSVWGVAMIFFRSTTGIFNAIFSAQILYAVAIFIPIFFLFFTYVFLNEDKPLPTRIKLLSLVSGALLVFLIFIPGALIKTVSVTHTQEPIIVFNQVLNAIYTLYIIGMFAWVYLVLWKKYKTGTTLEKTKIFYILLGGSIPTLVGLVTNLILPSQGIFTYNWMGQISTVVTAGLITYGIFKHRIFDIRVLGAEILIFTLWTISFGRILFSATVGGVIFNTVAFIVIIIVGTLLIRSITKEVETRTTLETLAKKLQKANKRLKELDQQKSEFLSIATHQLRGPLAGIRGHLSLILDGSYGKVSTKASEIILKVFESSGLLAQTINDFLNVSRIEQGSMQYDKKEFKVGDLLETIVEEIETLAKKRGLKLTLTNNCKENECLVHADYAKINHIFFNLIDNAIKYTEQGWIKISVVAHDKKVRIEVSDSGVGIDQDEIDNLFEKFVRARGASGINVNGTGLGLYVARQMVEAHDGKIWAESAGKGKGSTFVVELPVK